MSGIGVGRAEIDHSSKPVARQYPQLSLTCQKTLGHCT